LLEQPLPELCADRIDYTLRDLRRLDRISASDVDAFLSALTVHDGRIVTTSFDAAEWFATRYFEQVRELFLDPLEIFANYRLAQAVRAAVTLGYINEAALLDTDASLLQTLASIPEQAVTSPLNDLTPATLVCIDDLNFEVDGSTKWRYVDPLVLTDEGDLTRASDSRPSIAQMRDELRRLCELGVRVRRA